MNLTMNNYLTKIFALGGLALQLSGCGTVTDNIDILNSTTLPVLSSYLSTGTYAGATTSFTAAAPYWTFTSSNTFFAPARGIVGEIAGSSIVSGTSSVTIIHSGRVLTRIHGINTLSVRSGDSVIAGQALGTNTVSSVSAFQVMVDGVLSCPVSFINATLRSGLAANPCL